MLKKMKKIEKNRTKPGNPYYLVLFENRTKPGTVLSETVLSGDPLYWVWWTWLLVYFKLKFYRLEQADKSSSIKQRRKSSSKNSRQHGTYTVLHARYIYKLWYLCLFSPNFSNCLDQRMHFCSELCKPNKQVCLRFTGVPVSKRSAYKTEVF